MFVDKESNSITLNKPKTKEIGKTFTYDGVFDSDSLQQSVYDEAAFGLVESCLEGYNGTIFAYGQTGCGKTHTMMGSVKHDGVIPKAFNHIFGFIDGDEGTRKFLV